MAVSRHLGFYRTANSAIRFAKPENRSLEPNMEWIGCTVCEIFAFKLYRDLENGVRGHSSSSKMAPFDRAHTTLYSSSIVTIGSRALSFSDPYIHFACLSVRHSVCLSENSTLNISETRPDSGMVTMDGLYKLAYGLSIGHTPDDVT